MVKQLLIVRHAEAREPQNQQRDTERDLTARGYQDAVRVGNYLRGLGWQPDLMISSSATRAMASAQMIAEQIRYPAQRIQSNNELYDASLRTFLSIINQQEDTNERIMIVGHNLTVSYLIEYLTGEEVGSVAPAGFAIIEPTVEHWQEVSQNTATLASYKAPETLS
uniref:Histidine phosphatase family protein n=1 Tax=Roseihalotalea indica TaxID=2867963 RepID=A0AA49JBJ1_9BACT|nr:histidine phosphatase family protein [Tunicatimonas sp. TK19036]